MDESPSVYACGYASPTLIRLGDDGIIDEARVVIRAHNGTTAYFTFSTQMRPVLHQFRIYGPKNGIVVDRR